MKKYTIYLFFCSLLLSPSLAHGQACDGGSWTISSTEPVTCLPYAANGIFTKRLPSDIMDHIATGGSARAANILTNGGLDDASNVITPASPGTDAWSSKPMYYGQSSDPLYHINSCGGSCDSSVVDTFWHIPNQAEPNATSDGFFSVWDQTKNKVLSIYNPGTFPACTADTEAEAEANCSLDFLSGTGVQYSDYTTSTDYSLSGSNGHAGNSLYNQDPSLTIRQKEWIAGEINHALYLNVYCTSSDDAFVFPMVSGQGTLTPCDDAGKTWDSGNASTGRPYIGNLVFLDYTDAEIDAMGLPTWQEAIVRALSRYGGYIGDTTTDQVGYAVARIEGGEAYEFASLEGPLYDWLEDDQMLSPITATAPNSLRRWVLDWTSGIANLEDHIHIADECVALGLAELPGGCVDVPTEIPESSCSNSANLVSIITCDFVVHPQANQVLVVAVGLYSPSTEAVSSITHGATALTAINSEDDGVSRCELWYLTSPTTGNGTVTVNLNASSYVTVGALVLANISQSATIKDAGTDFGTSSPASTTLTTSSGNLLVDAIWQQNTDGITAGTGQNQQMNFLASSQDRFAMSTKTAADTSTSMSWTLSASNDFAQCATALNLSSIGVTYYNLFVPRGLR